MAVGGLGCHRAVGSANVRSETDRVSTAGDGLRASYLASGALERGILWVMWGNLGLTYTAPDGLPRFWSPNMRRLPMRFPSGDALVEVIPENSKLNINTADPEDLYRVVFAVSGDPGARGRSRMALWIGAAPRRAPVFSTNTISAWVRLFARAMRLLWR